MRERDSKLWGWFTEYADGTTGVVGVMVEDSEGFKHFPLLARDEALVRGFKGLAASHGAKTGQPVWLRCWHAYDDEPDLGEEGAGNE